MKKLSRIILLSALVGAVALTGLVMQSGPSGAAQVIDKQAEAQDVAGLTLAEWQKSSQEAKLSFLYGFVTMLMWENTWQGDNVLPISQSSISIWARGLKDERILDICKAIDQYAAEFPNQSELNVLAVMSKLYVRPMMNDAERKAAYERWKEVKSGR